MTSTERHQPTPDDVELEALLARAGRVHAAWREASAEEPPAALDDAIRAAARRAVGAGPRPVGASSARRWRVPLSIAAVLVVSATLTLLLSERAEHLPGADLRKAPHAPEADAGARDAGAPAASAEPGRIDAPSARSRRAEPAAHEPSLAQHSTVPPGALSSAPASASKSLSRDELRPPVGPESAPTQPAVTSAEKDIAPLRQAELSAADAGAAAGAAPAVSPSAAAEPRSKARAQSEERADGSMPPLLPGEVVRGSREAHIGTAQQASPQTPAAAPALPAKRAAEPARVAGRAEDAASAEGEALEATLGEPRAWIDRIIALRREGRLEEAQRSLERFRRRFPDYRLPPELASLPSSPRGD